MKALDRRPPAPPAVNTDRYSLQWITEGKIDHVHPRQRHLLLASAVVVVAAAVVAALVTIHQSAAPRAAGTPTPSAAALNPTMSAPATVPASTSVSVLPTVVPTATPSGVTWSLLAGIALPASKTDGPTTITGPVYAGYSHTPTGALLAAVNIQYRALLTPGQGWRQVVTTQILPGAMRDRYIAFRAQVTDEADSRLTQIAGFRFITYDPTVAVISLASRSQSNVLQSSELIMRWAGGDWRLDLPQASQPATPIASLQGFVAWQGVG